MASVSSLRYNRDETYNAKDTFTKAGAFIYGGSATEFHEWEFRTMLKVRGTKPEEICSCISKIVEGLFGDAFQIARDVGLEVLTDEGNLPWLPPRPLQADPRPLLRRGHLPVRLPLPPSKSPSERCHTVRDTTWNPAQENNLNIVQIT